MSSRGGILLPSGVLERLPFLRESKALFFDFGLLLLPEDGGAKQVAQQSGEMERHHPQSEHHHPIVLVLTNTDVVIAAFPAAALPTRVLPLEAVAGITREGDAISLRNSGGDDVTLRLPKVDTFVVHLIDVQDRSIGRSLRLSAHPSPGDAEAPMGNHTADLAAAGKALRHASSALGETEEARLGVVRFGFASVRCERPSRELDEGSDASSVQTIDHEAAQDTEEEVPALAAPSAYVDSTALHRRLFYFFQHYDRTKLPLVADIVNRHRGREAQLMAELERRYGPEPRRDRWATRDHLAHHLEINAQLRAQLRRAKDELLTLAHDQEEQADALQRVLRRKDELLQRMLLSEGDTSVAASNQPATIGALELLRVQGWGTVHEAYFPAPTAFFAFVVEQTKLVSAAAAPPVALLAPVSGASQAVYVNRPFLSSVVVSCAPHSVSTRRGGRWCFIPSTEFWPTDSAVE